MTKSNSGYKIIRTISSYYRGKILFVSCDDSREIEAIDNDVCALYTPDIVMYFNNDLAAVEMHDYSLEQSDDYSAIFGEETCIAFRFKGELKIKD